ncbi:symporter [Burkholderia pseudomallei]|nr:shikimate transporter [Burkholderia pseudomallei 668]KGD19344.1 putative shikimate transporter [Burkholderia pseudomallei]KGD58005.1 metabolite/H+ symporter, major facilitator superfamily [Burkholderia pseudomallei]KMM28119.1 symporter [Burkholderia pseudomallei]ONC33499.1 symporter [Burkholderia pseudomallei]
MRASMDGAQAFVEQVEHGRRRLKLPVREALTRHPKAFVYIVALRLAEPFTMYDHRVRAQLFDVEPRDVARSVPEHRAARRRRAA